MYFEVSHPALYIAASIVEATSPKRATRGSNRQGLVKDRPDHLPLEAGEVVGSRCLVRWTLAWLRTQQPCPCTNAKDTNHHHRKSNSYYHGYYSYSWYYYSSSPPPRLLLELLLELLRLLPL